MGCGAAELGGDHLSRAVGSTSRTTATVITAVITATPAPRSIDDAARAGVCRGAVAGCERPDECRPACGGCAFASAVCRSSLRVSDLAVTRQQAWPADMGASSLRVVATARGVGDRSKPCASTRRYPRTGLRVSGFALTYCQTVSAKDGVLTDFCRYRERQSTYRASRYLRLKCAARTVAVTFS